MISSTLPPPVIGGTSRPAVGRPESTSTRTPKWGVVVLCGAAALALTAGLDGTVVGWLLGISMLVVPGIFVADLVAPRSATERLVIVIATSVVTWMVVAHVLLSLQWWEPRLAGVVVLTASALSGAVWRAGTPTTTSLRVRFESLLQHIGRAQLIWSAIAIGIWAGSLPYIDTAFDDWGLITAVPPTFFVGWVLAVSIAAVAATTTDVSPRRLAAGIAPLLLMVYGTLPLLFDTIRYPWAYKHVGVIRLLDETGRFHPDVDIYNNFSGFFGVGALLRGATGVDPTSYAPWAQLAAEAAILTAVWLLVRRATNSERVAHLATVLYLITNWVGQNYFAAQSLGSYLCLAFLALTIGWFMDGTARQPRRAPQWLRRRLDGLRLDTTDRASALHWRARRVVVLAIFLGLMMTHPLTPVVAIGAVGAAWVIGWIRDGWLVVGVGVIAAGWAVRCIAYFAAQSFDLGFGGRPTDNASGNLDVSGAPAAVLAVSDLTRGFSLAVWGGALIGGLVCAWAMRRTSLLLVAVMIPFGLPLVQSYGGEVVYRVYLYSLPMIVAFAAWGIVATAPVTPRRRWSRTTVLATMWCLLMSAGFLVAHYGREAINTVSPSEVAMDDYIAQTVADPALLAQFDGIYPAASSARYPGFQVNDTYTPYVVEMLGRQTTLPPPAALDDVADDLIALDAGVPYVIVSPGMIDSVRQVNSFPVTSTDDAVAFLVTNPRFVVRHQIDDTWLVEVLP